MRKLMIGALTTGLGIALSSGAADAGKFDHGRPECNWGAATATAIADGHDQGGHASDPSQDGHGSDTADEPRVGLANMTIQGELDETCQFITELP